MLDVFTSGSNQHTPLTTTEVADAVSGPRRTVYEKLEGLVADGILQSKKVGARARIWWVPVDAEMPVFRGKIDHELIEEQMREIRFRSELVADLLRPAENTDFLATLEGIVRLDDGGQLEYWKVKGMDSVTFVEALAEFPTFANIRLVSTKGDVSRFEVEVTPKSLMSIFAQFDGRLVRAEIDREQLTMVGEFPITEDVSNILAAGKEAVPDLVQVSERLVYTPRLFRHLVESDLTDRQWTALQAAYHSGYFTVPRESTGDEVAARLGVTRQTFHHHLRHAEAEVCRNLFEDIAHGGESPSNQ